MTDKQCPAGRVFQYRVGSGIGQNTGYRVGFGSGRSVEICDWVFPGISFTLGYFRVFRVFSGIFGYFGYLRVLMGINRYLQVYYISSLFLSGIFGYFSYFWVCRVFSGISGFTHIY